MDPDNKQLPSKPIISSVGDLAKQKVSRRDFIVRSGSAILAVAGVGSIIKLLSGEHSLNNKSHGYELLAHKDRPDGYAGLDGSGKIPLNLLPAQTASTPNLTSLGSLSDVNSSNPSNNQVLTYNGVSGKWTNQSLPSSQVTSVAGKTGDVSLAESDITGLTADLSSKASKSLLINSGTGLSGGGDLSANRTLSVLYGTTAGTAMAGNDSRIAGAEQTANKGIAGGYAPLNGSSLVPTAYLGTGTASSSSYLRGDGIWSTPPGAPVFSVFGRTGIITAQSGDYTAAQVGALPSTDDLSAIASANATVGNVSLNSHKITNLTNGSVSSDAAAFGQIPTSLPPNGTAGGDLTGTYPNPTLNGTSNVESIISANTTVSGALQKTGGTMSGAIAMGVNKITGLTNGSASSDAAAFGQIPTSLPPGGAAGGDLVGTYPNPTLTGTSNVESIITANTTVAGAEQTANKGVASGYVGLDSNSHVSPTVFTGPGWPGLRGSELRTARAAWANRANTPMNILSVGDSVTVGYFGTTSIGSYTNIMASRLAAANGQNNPPGYYAIDWAGNTLVAYSERLWTMSGSPTFNTDIGLAYGNVSIHSGDALTSPSVTCDRLWVHYPHFTTFTGQLNVFIDNDGVTGSPSPNATLSVGGQSSTQGGRIWDSGTLTRGSHYVTLRPTTATTTRAEGVTFFDGNGGTSGTSGAGLRYFNGSHFGYSTTQFAASGLSSWWTDGLDSIAPHLVLIYLGINDQAGSVSTSQYQTNLGTIISRINTVAAANTQQNPSVILMVPYGTGASSSLSTPYQQAARAAAAANGAAYFDFSELFGYVGTQAADIDSLMSPSDPTNSKKHPNNKGHQLLGETLASYLLNAFGPTAASSVVIDTLATDIQPLGTQAAGSIGKAADSGHVHAMPRLDQINNPTASVSLNSQKITSLANGTASTDAAAFGQIPTALPPNGSASGDLSGSYPGPTVAKLNGISVSGTPSTNQVLTATSTTAASWQPVPGGGGVTLDSTSSDIQPLGTQAAGSIGKAADSGHVHAMPRLDQINNPTASVSLNSQKITSLANGTASTDAAAFGQTPAGLTTTKGDIIIGTGSGTVARHAAPANGTLLIADSTQTDGWRTFSPMFPPRILVSGKYTTVGGNATTLAMTLNLLYALPFMPASSQTLSKLSINVTTNTASSTVRLGIYSDNGSGYPGSLLLDAGTVDTHTAVGLAEATISQVVTGMTLYWLVAVSQTASPTITSTNAVDYSIPITTGGDVTLPCAGYGQAGVSGALPGNFTVTLAEQGQCPRIMVKV